jgi:hypothetical protein
MLRLRRATVAALLALSLTACGGATGASVTLDEQNKSTTVRIGVGTTVIVVLHSTYWMFDPLPGHGVLEAVGTPTASAPGAPGVGCVPGGGCGTVTAIYTAMATGSVIITASRNSCGEALRCSPDEARYEVTIVVGDPAGPPSSSEPGPPTGT